MSYWLNLQQLRIKEIELGFIKPYCGVRVYLEAKITYWSNTVILCQLLLYILLCHKQPAAHTSIGRGELNKDFLAWHAPGGAGAEYHPVTSYQVNGKLFCDKISGGWKLIL